MSASNTTFEKNGAIRSQEEVAAMLGITRGGVSYHERIALRKLLYGLREELSDVWEAYTEGER